VCFDITHPPESPTVWVTPGSGCPLGRVGSIQKTHPVKYSQRSVLLKMKLVVLLLLLCCLVSLGAEKYAWFTASSLATNRCYLLLQAAVESVLQCCTDKLFPVVLFESDNMTTVPPWLRILHDNGAIHVAPHRLTWFDDIPKRRQYFSTVYYRLDIPFVMPNITKAVRGLSTDYALYTDCDALIYQLPEFIKPKFLTVGPELVKGRTDNTGVMFMNLTALLPALPPFLNFVKKNTHWNDQECLLAYYSSSNFTLLPDEYNWKPYWGESNDTAILHTHGAKFSSCMEVFLLYRFEKDHHYGQMSSCTNSKAYSRVNKAASLKYHISYEKQMSSYLRYSAKLFKLLIEMEQRLLRLTGGREISTYY
jgi:hypothetical protein